MKPVTVRTRRITVVLVVLAALALPVAAYQLGGQIDDTAELTADNCLRVHRVVRTLDEIIGSSRAQVYAYEREGTITVAQRDRALANQAKQREKLSTADCPTPKRKRP